jgi:hypothetical protein
MDKTTLQNKLGNYVWNVNNVLPNDEDENQLYMTIAYNLSDDFYNTIIKAIHQNVFKGIHVTESDYIVAVGYVYRNLVQ